MARENPYNRLKRILSKWIFDNVLYRKTKVMWVVDFSSNAYDLKELRYKIETADNLGYTIELSTNSDHHVVFKYVKKLPTNLPFELRY